MTTQRTNKSWVSAACAVIAMLLTPALADAGKPRFKQVPVDLNTKRVFDVSVADIEGDGDLDMFSTGHRYRGALLESRGGGLVDRLDQSGLSSTAHIPGFDNQFRRPSIGPAGLYIWIDREGNTHIRTHQLRKLDGLAKARVTGRIRFIGRGVQVLKRSGSKLSISTDKSTDPQGSFLDFDAGPDSVVVVRAQFMDLPFDTEVDTAFPRQRILLGPRRSIPPSHAWRVDLGDRHGVAWGDFNQDGAIDAYISNGGNRGGIRRLGPLVKDEFYFSDGDGRFVDAIDQARINKGFCRGRYATPVDFDADSDLDLFVGCERGNPLLYAQKQPGRFGARFSLMQAAKVHGDLYRWIDIRKDRQPELVAVVRNKIQFYKRNKGNGKFVRLQSFIPKTLGKTPGSISVVDIEDDGDADVFVASRGGNIVLVNAGGRLKPRRPEKYGLPKLGSVAANFLDFDNDGRLDVHLVPQGLVKRKRSGRFKATGKLALGGNAQWATANWLDTDSDGDRDLVAVIKRGGEELPKRRYVNRTRGGNWLEVDLDGPAGNMDGVGAKVTVKTARGRQVQWVGQSEGSRYSMGHYRLYFGLGNALSAKRLEVEWPGGGETSLRSVRANRLVTVEASE